MSQPPYPGPNPDQPPGYSPQPGQQPGYPPQNYPPQHPGYPPQGYQQQAQFGPPPGYPPQGYAPVAPAKAKSGLKIPVVLGALALLIVVGVVLAVVLGKTEPGVVPTYTNATALTTSAKLNDTFKEALKDANNSSILTYKSADGNSQIKSFYVDQMKKNGWSDQTSKLGDSNVKAIESLGGFALGYEKGNEVAVIFGYPGIVAKANDINGVSNSETLLVVIRAEGKL